MNTEICQKCKYWGEGDGKGYPYDAGHVNYCQHPLISGAQHPSSCSYRTEEISKLMVNGGGDTVYAIMTRWNFGCNQFETICSQSKEK